jgi:serine/threonine-protein kinase
MTAPPEAAETRSRYLPLAKIASGGTAAVHVGVETPVASPPRLVALKKPHAHLASDRGFREELLREARLASRIAHPNVAGVREVEATPDEITLVMEWVEGASLSDLVRAFLRAPSVRHAPIAIRIVLDACEGLHAAHELRGDDGALLGLVHRDVSPQNVLVGVDGIAKLADFGLAKPLYAAERTTSEGALRGKLGYMAPEYVKSGAIDRRTDVFAMGVVAWEAIARKRLFRGENDAQTIDRVREAVVPALGPLAPELSKVAAAALDGVLARALAKFPDERFPTARAFADALADVARTHDLVATHEEVASAFDATLRAELAARRTEIESKLGPTREAEAVVLQATPLPRRRTGRTIAIVAGTAIVIASATVVLATRTQTERQTTTTGTTISSTATATASATATATSTPTPTPTSTSTSTSTPTPTPTSTATATATIRHPRPNPYGR